MKKLSTISLTLILPFCMAITNCSKASSHENDVAVNGAASLQIAGENPAPQSMKMADNATAKPSNNSVNNAPEKAMLKAMTIVDGDETYRAFSSGLAIQEFMKAGIVNKKPEARVDYMDLYAIHKPYKIMGHDLVGIGEEYMTQYAGCCVNENVTIVVKSNSNDESLFSFAEQNKCKVDENYDVKQDTQYTKVMLDNNAKYIQIQCRNAQIKK